MAQCQGPSSPSLYPASFLLVCPRQDYGFCSSSNDREGVSSCGGSAGRGQHHYSGKTSLGAQWVGEEEGVVLSLGMGRLRAQDPLNDPRRLASQVRTVLIWIPALPLPSCVNLSKQLDLSVPVSPSIDYVFTVGTVEWINPQINGPQIRKSA